jgi:hypothetical protein
MTKYWDPATFQYGSELEYGDINKLKVATNLPKDLGIVEWSEKEICNQRPPYAGIAVDPDGINPPVGGEINTMPTVGWEAQWERVLEITSWLLSQSETPTASFTSPFHIHTHIPGLMEDIHALKRLAAYTYHNQRDLVETCYRFEIKEDMRQDASMYMRFDGGRLMPEYIIRNIVNRATDFASFIHMFAVGIDGVTPGRPFRYAVNLYCMKHTRTIEHRYFRATLNPHYLRNAFMAVELFLTAALNGGPPILEVFKAAGLTKESFAPMRWDAQLWDMYAKTRKPDTPLVEGKKNRQFWEVT